MISNLQPEQDYRSSDETPASEFAEAVESVKHDAKRWLHNEKELAAAELSSKAKLAGLFLFSLIGAAFVLYTGIILFLIAGAFGLGELIKLTGLNGFASYLLGVLSMSIITLSAGGITVFIVIQKLSAGALLPSRTVESLNNLKRWVNQKIL